MYEDRIRSSYGATSYPDETGLIPKYVFNPTDKEYEYCLTLKLYFKHSLITGLLVDITAKDSNSDRSHIPSFFRGEPKKGGWVCQSENGMDAKWISQVPINVKYLTQEKIQSYTKNQKFLNAIHKVFDQVYFHLPTDWEKVIIQDYEKPIFTHLNYALSSLHDAFQLIDWHCDKYQHVPAKGYIKKHLKPTYLDERQRPVSASSPELWGFELGDNILSCAIEADYSPASYFHPHNFQIPSCSLELKVNYETLHIRIMEHANNNGYILYGLEKEIRDLLRPLSQITINHNRGNSMDINIARVHIKRNLGLILHGAVANPANALGCCVSQYID